MLEFDINIAYIVAFVLGVLLGRLAHRHFLGLF